MTPDEIAEARVKLGLTSGQMADMLDISRRYMNKMQSPVGSVSHMRAPARVARLIKAYLAGYRPEDWPAPVTRKRK